MDDVNVSSETKHANSQGFILRIYILASVVREDYPQ